MFRHILLGRAARSLVRQATQGCSQASSTTRTLPPPDSFHRQVAFFGNTSLRRSEEELPDDPIDLDKPQVREIGNANVRRLADEIVKLSLLETGDLTKILQEKLGITDSMLNPVGGAMPAGMPGGGEAEADEGATTKTDFDLKLESFDKGQKIKVIKEVRAIAELGLKEAKELVESAPVVLKKSVKKEDGEELIEKLKKVGAVVVLE